MISRLSTILALSLFLAPTGVAGRPLCRNGTASATSVRAVAHTAPLVSAKLAPHNIGSRVATSMRAAALPKGLVSMLPQYADYKAVRTGRRLIIIDPRSRRAVYFLPLKLAGPMRCPVS